MGAFVSECQRLGIDPPVKVFKRFEDRPFAALTPYDVPEIMKRIASGVSAPPSPEACAFDQPPF